MTFQPGWLKEQVREASVSVARARVREAKRAMDKAIEALDKAEDEWHKSLLDLEYLESR